MTIFFVDNTEALSARWFLNGVELTTGTVYVYIYRNNAGTIEYLRTDLTGWDSTYASGSHEFSTTYTTRVGWLLSLTIPSSANGHTINIVAVHSSSATIPLTGFALVTTPENFNHAAFALNGVL